MKEIQGEYLVTSLTAYFDLNVDKRCDEERRKILIWLSPDDFEQTHEGHLKKRFEKTGQWLLDDPRFMSWRDDEQSSLLWCHGARK